MGLGGISTLQLLIVLVIALMIFGSTRIRSLGYDLGGMFKGIRQGFKEFTDASEELTPELEDLKKDYQKVQKTAKRVSK